jgi:hypothetical protein
MDGLREEYDLPRDELCILRKQLSQLQQRLDQQIAEKQGVEILLSQAYEDLDEMKEYFLALYQSHKEQRLESENLRNSILILLRRLNRQAGSANALLTRISQKLLF